MLARCFDRSRHQLKAGMTEDLYCLVRGDAPDAMLPQQLFYTAFGEFGSLFWSRGHLQQRPGPGLIRCRAQFQQLRIIALQLLPKLAAMTIEAQPQFLIEPGEITQPNYYRLICPNEMKTPPVCSQRCRNDIGIAAIILCSCREVPVAKSIQLLRVDGIDRQATLEQGLHQSATRHF